LYIFTDNFKKTVIEQRENRGIKFNSCLSTLCKKRRVVASKLFSSLPITKEKSQEVKKIYFIKLHMTYSVKVIVFR
jgi:hypothetical protein